MKKWILFLMAIAAIEVYATDYTYKYLVFTSSDGTSTALPADGLRISINGGSLVVSSQAGTTTLSASGLTKMKFSSDNVTTAIDSAADAVAEGGQIAAYSLSGLYKGTFSSTEQMKSSLATGIYVIKQNGKSTKMIIK